MGALLEKYINDIVDNVAVKVYKEIEDDKNLDDTLKSVMLKPPTNLVVKFCSIPFYKEDRLNERIEELKELFSVMQQKELDVVLDYLSRVVQLYMEWSEKNKIDVDLSVFDELLGYTKEEDDMFFDFDSDFTDENIGHMHYVEEEKIKAEDFLSVYNKGELEDIEDRLHNILDYCVENCTDTTFSSEYLENMISFLEMIKDFFDEFEEFKDLSYSLDKLINKLSTIDVDMFDDSQKLILHGLLEKIYVDLDGWAGNVVFSKNAIDIHYIDASLTANVDQIEIILNYMSDAKQEPSEDSGEDEGDIEFF